MENSWTFDSLNQLIVDKVEESLHLDYKAADAFDLKSESKKNEIAKDISAFANSDGGTLIYGMIESGHLPEAIDPISRVKNIKETLEQITNSRISPRVHDIIITTVSIPNTSDEKLLVIVYVPKSFTAHMANGDNRYYRRFNFMSIPMQDFEVRDVFNRKKDPIIDIEFEQVTLYENGIPRYVVHVFARNNGKILANYINCTLSIPSHILERADYHKGSIKPVIEELTNSLQNMDKGIFFTPPLLPSKRMHLKEFYLHPFAFDYENNLNFTVYADNMEPRSATIRIRDIPNVSRYDFAK